MNRHLLLKIWLLIATSTLLMLHCSAQEYFIDDEDEYDYKPTRNELKLNTTSIILDSHPELTYEFLFNSGISLGTRLGFSFDKEFRSSYRNQFQAMPYVRWNYLYGFRDRRNYYRGYFYGLNFNMSLYTPYLEDFESQTTTTEPFLLLGGGMEWGYKYKSQSNWIFEFSVVAGRYASNPHFKRYRSVSILFGKTF